MDKKKKALLFILITSVSLIGSAIWIIGFINDQPIIDLSSIQIILLGIWMQFTIIYTLYEKLFTKKKNIFSSIKPLLLFLVSIFIPLFNLLIIIPLGFFFSIKDFKQKIKYPRQGGLALTIFALSIGIITLIKSIQVFIITLNIS